MIGNGSLQDEKAMVMPKYLACARQWQKLGTGNANHLLHVEYCTR